MSDVFKSFLESHGYLAVFLLVGLESLGIPLPGETALVTAAAFAASGRLSIFWVVMIAAVAAIVGDNGGYWIGRKGGMPLILRCGHFVHLDEKKLQRAHTFFEHHGSKTVFLGRFVALLRTWTALLAGVAQMPYGIFTLYNALGGIAWSVLFGTVGYAFGRNLPRLERYIGRASLAAALLATLVATFFIAWRWSSENSSAISEVISRFNSRIAEFRLARRLKVRFPRIWRFLTARFAPAEYMGLHLTIGLLVSILGLWLIAGVTEDVIHHDPLTLFDLAVFDWFHAHTNLTGMKIFGAITWLGSPLLMAVFGFAVASLLLLRRHFYATLGWISALIGAAVLNLLLKQLVKRPRPQYAEVFLHDHSFSFPSGHAIGALVTYGMIAYLLALFWAKQPRTQVLISLAAVILILGIGFSRLYLGVHYFSDVVGGYAAGILWLSTCITALEILRRQPSSGVRV